MASGKGVSLRLLPTTGDRLLKSAAPGGAAERNDRPQWVAAMAPSDILLVDDAQDSCISLSDVI
jgi:hypothetical protein